MGDREGTSVALIRALTYASLILALLFALLPAEGLAGVGLGRPERLGVMQLAGIAIGVGGALLALWCAVVFATRGRGTPLPFDPPRRLVVTGPYRFVRNPMAVGVALILVGMAVYYQSVGMLLVAAGFVLVIHLMVIGYEEPTLRRTFGEEYDAYVQRVRRWWPRF